MQEYLKKHTSIISGAGEHKKSSELCGTHTREYMFDSTVSLDKSSNNTSEYDKIHKRIIEEHCGSDTIVTILRLRPGTHILPHCGTTNRRLIMHFVLRGRCYSI